jgi:hypothetical protein
MLQGRAPSKGQKILHKRHSRDGSGLRWGQPALVGGQQAFGVCSVANATTDRTAH